MLGIILIQPPTNLSVFRIPAQDLSKISCFDTPCRIYKPMSYFGRVISFQSEPDWGTWSRVP